MSAATELRIRTNRKWSKKIRWGKKTLRRGRDMATYRNEIFRQRVDTKTKNEMYRGRARLRHTNPRFRFFVWNNRWWTR